MEKKIKDLAKLNNYPNGLINKVMTKVLLKFNNNSNLIEAVANIETIVNIEKEKIFFTITYSSTYIKIKQLF